MMTKKKILTALALVVCAVLLVVGSVAGTLAYMTHQTSTIRNTFTVGNVRIFLDEAPVNTSGKKTDGPRVLTNSYHLIPDKEYDKDPTIHIDAKSENCYLFVSVANGIAQYETAEATKTIAGQMTAKGWVRINGGDVWYYSNNGGIATHGQDIKIFETFEIAHNAALPSDVSSIEIDVTAYAVQAEGFATALEAWNATFGATNNSTETDAPGNAG